MGYDVKIEIDQGKTGGTFTNHDIVSGKVKLTTTSALTLTFIQVKLEGVAQTQLVIPAGNSNDIGRNRDRRREKDKFRSDTHKVLYDSLIVFPPENVRSVSQAKDFTLTPGTYNYDFSFRIPVANSCKKLSGISNKVSFSKNSFDVVINNGNFNGRYLMNSANNFLNDRGSSSAYSSANQYSQDYHVDAQLPPTLSDMKGMASVNYFVKVTCRRASFLKSNLRAQDPFVFLPLDLDNQYGSYREGQHFEEYRERFYRRDLVFKNRIPDVVGVKMSPVTKALPSTPESRSTKFFGSFFGGNSPRNAPTTGYSSTGVAISSVDVPFAFEMRMAHPPSLSPTSTPKFKLFLVSDLDPSQYTLAKYGKPEESNGLGVVFLQRLKFELMSNTLISVVDNDGTTREIHQSRVEETLPLCNNSYQNLALDLGKCRKQRSSSATSSNFVGANAYELEIPSRYYENFRLPRNLPPTFRTCNIARTYGLSVVAGFSSEKISESATQREMHDKVQFVDIFCPDIQVLSGLKLTSTLHSNASGTSLGKVPDTRPGGVNTYPPDIKAPLDEKRAPPLPSKVSQDQAGAVLTNRTGLDSVNDMGLSLPTYDDVVRESSYQDDSEHQRARRRYAS